MANKVDEFLFDTTEEITHHSADFLVHLFLDSLERYCLVTAVRPDSCNSGTFGDQAV